jgi:hypothetical protein
MSAPPAECKPPRDAASPQAEPLPFLVMKHLTVESKDLLIGDEAADALTEYAALVAKQGTGDRVDIHAFSSDGDEVVATIVLSGGTTLLVETAHNTLPEPDNTEAIAYMHGKIREAASPPPVQPDSDFEAYETQFDEL